MSCATLPPGSQTIAPPNSLEQGHSLYKKWLSPMLHTLSHSLLPGDGCRFQPTCSEYTLLAFSQHGPLRGIFLSATRLLRCHPFSRGGWDPVPFGPLRATNIAPAAPAGTIGEPHSIHDSV